MKTTLLTLAAVLGLSITATASDVSPASPLSGTNWLTFIEAAGQAKQLTLIAAPSYAPEIVVDGKKAPWGVTLAALYPVLDAGPVRTLTGARIDYLADKLFTPSVDVQLQTTILLFGKVEFTPFITGGAIFPFGQGNSSGSIGALGGVGAGAKIFKWDKGSISLGYNIEKWTCFPGVIHHIGGAATFLF